MTTLAQGFDWTGQRTPLRKTAIFGIALVCALGLALNIWFAVLNREGLGVDFNQFYAAGRLAGTGHLYDWDALRKMESENGREVTTGRLPVVLYGYKVFGSVPYRVARAVYMTCSIAALGFFVASWPGTRRLITIVALAWSMPVSLLILQGQDVPFWLLFFSAGLLLLHRNKTWTAGLVFALCLCKYHLALGIPVMLVAQKRWRTLLAASIAVLMLIACCFWIEGLSWPAQYPNMLHMSIFSPAPERMPNLHGIASWLPAAAPLEIGGAVTIVWLLWTACARTSDPGMAGAAASACGLLLGAP